MRQVVDIIGGIIGIFAWLLGALVVLFVVYRWWTYGDLKSWLVVFAVLWILGLVDKEVRRLWKIHKKRYERANPMKAPRP